MSEAYHLARQAQKGYVTNSQGKASMWLKNLTLKNIWPEIVEIIEHNKHLPFTESYSEIPISGMADISFRGGFYCPANKCVYMMPSKFDKVLKLDTLTDTYEFLTIPPEPGIQPEVVERFSTARYSAGFGYSLVANNQKILGIDTRTDEMFFFPDSRLMRISNLGSPVADTGYMYSAPVSSTFFLKTDLIGRFYNIVRLPSGMAAEMLDEWAGLILAPNNCMYSPPENGLSILKLDAQTDIVTKLEGNPITGRFRNGAITANESIYFFPYMSPDILKLDTKTETYSLIPANTGSFFSQSGVLLPNGHIYIVPWQGDKIKRLNPEDDSITDVFNVTPDIFKWGKSVETPQGVYLCPTNFEKIGKITIDSDWIPFTDFIYESGYIGF